jgi:hypothetical protein
MAVGGIQQSTKKGTTETAMPLLLLSPLPLLLPSPRLMLLLSSQNLKWLTLNLLGTQ